MLVWQNGHELCVLCLPSTSVAPSGDVGAEVLAYPSLSVSDSSRWSFGNGNIRGRCGLSGGRLLVGVGFDLILFAGCSVGGL